MRTAPGITGFWDRRIKQRRSFFRKGSLLILMVVAPLSAGEALMQDKVSYAGWKNCVRLTNGQIELIATTDVGPRIIRFGFVNGENVFKEYSEEIGKTGGDLFRVYGGHRLWQAPEDIHRTYAPDNLAVSFTWNGRTLKLTQKADVTGIEKELEISMDKDRNHVTVAHRLINRNASTVDLAPWALTALAPGGRAILPQEPFRAHADYLLPVRTLALWGYTNMQDQRWSWGPKYIQLRQDANASTEQKVGMANTQGWAAYILGGNVFLKRFGFEAGGRYPDFGSNCESYTDAGMLELESLGPMKLLPPNGSVEHVEHWFLFRAAVGKDEVEIDKDLLPLVRQTDHTQP